MRKFVLPMSALILASLALAAWNPTPMSATDQNQKALSSQMECCVAPEQASVTEMNKNGMMCPMVMPMQSSMQNGHMSMSPIDASKAQSIPADAKMITILVPVGFTQMNGKQVMDANIDSSLANSVVLMSMSCNGQNQMQPMKLTPAANDVILLVPLSPSTITQPASTPIYYEGEMSMMPVDEQASSQGMAIEASGEGQIEYMCPR